MTGFKKEVGVFQSGYEKTGGKDDYLSYKLIEYTHGKYKIIIRLTQDNRFIAVDSIKVNKSFLSNKNWLESKHYSDVDKYYDDEEES